MSDYQSSPKGSESNIPYQPPYPAPAERRGMSGCAKAFLILGILAVVGSLACCVGGGLYLRSMAKMEPAEVKQIADTILTWEFNEAFQGRFAMKFFGFARMAVMADPERGTLMIADSKYASAKDFAQAMDRQMKSQGASGSEGELGEETELVEAGEREVEIKGEKVTLKFDKTVGSKSGKEYWEVVGVVPGNENPTFVMLKVQVDQFDEEAILDRFQSIR